MRKISLIVVIDYSWKMLKIIEKKNISNFSSNLLVYLFKIERKIKRDSSFYIKQLFTKTIKSTLQIQKRKTLSKMINYLKFFCNFCSMKAHCNYMEFILKFLLSAAVKTGLNFVYERRARLWQNLVNKLIHFTA